MTYSVPESQLGDFLERGLNINLNRELAVNIIEQFGGYDRFVYHYYNITLEGLDSERVQGFDTNAKLLDFFDRNKPDVLNAVANTARGKMYSSVTDFISALKGMKGVLSERDAYEGLYNEQSTQRSFVVKAMIIHLAEQLCDDYYMYVSGEIGLSF